jgi:hypothetical protein
MISKNTFIEDLVKVPGAARYLMKHNIKCLACGEPVWGTLEDAAREKGYTDADIDRFVEELNELESSPPDP